jgi:CHAT domain-containing protein
MQRAGGRPRSGGIVLGCLLQLLLLGTARAGEPDPAEGLLETERKAAPEPTGAASAEDPLARGAELYRVGRLEEAAVAWQAAAQASQARGDTEGQVSALLRVADAQHSLGRYEEAVQTLGAAQAALGEGGPAAQRAAVLGALGNARIALGPPELARRQLEEGLALAREAKDPALAAAILTNLGNLEASQERYAEASRAYSESAKLAEEAGRPDLAARALANAARAALLAGEPPASVREPLARAQALVEKLPPSHDQAYLLVNLARSWLRLPGGAGNGDRSGLEHAHQALRQAEAVATEIDDPLALSYATGYLGHLYEERGRTDEALALTRRAIFQAEQAAAPESLYRWLWQAGRLHRARGQTAQALESYQASVEVLDGIRFEMARGYGTGESSFREAVGPVFFEYVDLLLASAPPPSEVAAHQARLLQARQTVERLKAAELRDYFRDECVDAVQAKVESLDQVSTTAAVVYPILLEDRLELLLTLPGGMKRTAVDVGAVRLTQEVRRLRSLLEKRTTLEYLPHARQLYDWIVRPLEPDLAGLGVDTLVFVPDGPLRTIPMAALNDGERFLVDRYALAITPGLSLTDPRPLDRESLQLFLSGLSEGVQGFPPLEHVPEELAGIQGLYGGDLLLNQDFQLKRVEGTLAEHDFNVVHIASHGQFSEDVSQSFLLTWDDRLTMDRLADYVGLFRFRETPIELLTLSACETAAGDDRAALGLAGVAIKAGARSALGTLWSVNDASSAELVTSFYREIRAGAPSKAVALQRAQQKLREDPDWAHPFYWSPFLLISNWL